MEHCRIYGGCWGPEYIYNYFPSWGSLKLFGKLKLIECRNKVCPFKATVQASDWLIKCDSHHTIGELCIRSDFLLPSSTCVYICKRLQLFIVGHFKRCFFMKGFISSRLSFPSRKWLCLKAVVSFHVFFPGSDTRSRCEVRWNNMDKVPFQECKYEKDNISSCVNWSHFHSGSPLNVAVPFACIWTSLCQKLSRIYKKATLLLFLLEKRCSLDPKKNQIHLKLISSMKCWCIPT